MTLAFLRMLGRFPRRRLTLCVDGQARRYRTPCLFIGVNEYEVELLKVRRRCGMDGVLGGDPWPWRTAADRLRFSAP